MVAARNSNPCRTSTWNYFKNLSPGVAKCEICKQKIYFKTSIKHLKQHLLVKHKVYLGYKITKPFTKLDQQINIRRLIRMVREHPCLWDIQNIDFNNATEKRKAWNAIAFSLCPEMNPLIAAAELFARFSVLKENFFTDRLRLGSGINIRPSIYYQDLEFLDSSNDVINISLSSSLCKENEQRHMEFYENRPRDVSCSGNGLKNVLSAINGPTSIQHTNPKVRSSQRKIETLYVPASGGIKHGRNVIKVVSRHRKVKKANDLKVEENTLLQFMIQLQNADKDVLFLLSLIEELKKVPQEMKTIFKGELMMSVSQLMRKYKRMIYDGYIRDYVQIQ